MTVLNSYMPKLNLIALLLCTLIIGCQIQPTETIQESNISEKEDVGNKKEYPSLEISQAYIFKNVSREMKIFHGDIKSDSLNQDIFINMTLVNEGNDYLSCKDIYYQVKNIDDNFVNLYTLTNFNCIINKSSRFNFLIPISEGTFKELSGYDVILKTENKEVSIKIPNDLYLINYELEVGSIKNAGGIIGNIEITDTADYVYTIVNPSYLNETTNYDFYINNSIINEKVPLLPHFETSLKGKVKTDQIVKHKLITPNVEMIIWTNIDQVMGWTY